MNRLALALFAAACLACAGVPEAIQDALEPTPNFPPPEPVPDRPVFPVEVGDHWTWEVTREVGAGMRVLFMTDKPATTDVIATWDLTIDSKDERGHFAATLTRKKPDGLPMVTPLSLWEQDGWLWMEGPTGPEKAVTLTVPPLAVATERVPCVVAMFDGVEALCSPAPGGPLGVAPGPAFSVLHRDADGGKSLAQLLVGLGTAGLIIPGNRSASEYLHLKAFVPHTPPVTSPRVEAWRANPDVRRLDKALHGGLNREEGAAFIALAPPNARDEVVGAVLDALGPVDRPPVLRAALEAAEVPETRLEQLAVWAPRVANADPVQVDALVALFPLDQGEAVRGLLAGTWPVFAIALTPSEGEDRAAAVRAAVAEHPPSQGEAMAVLKRMGSSPELIDALLAKRAPAEQRALLTAAIAAESFDDGRVALLKGHEALFADADDAALEALLAPFTFGDGIQQGLRALMPALPRGRQATVLVLALHKVPFDDDRLALLRAWPDAVAGMTRAQKTEVLAGFPFEKDAARKALGM